MIDVRGVDDSAMIHVRDELKYRAADIIFFIRDERVAHEAEKRDLAELNSYLSWNETLETDRKIIEVIVPSSETIVSQDHNGLGATRDDHAVRSNLVRRGAFLETLRLVPIDAARACRGPAFRQISVSVSHGAMLPGDIACQQFQHERVVVAAADDRL